jgi:phosphopantetheinyl transferase
VGVFAEGLALTSVRLEAEGAEVGLLDLTQIGDVDSMARVVLTAREREEYAGLRHPLRRREWLGARAALKAILVRQGRLGEAGECEIRKDERGRPEILFAPGIPASGVADCSISHQGRFACVAVSCGVEARIGVDIEEISPRLLKVADAFAEDRQSRLRSRSVEERLAVLWAIKEACAKALGDGIGMAVRAVQCEETAEGRHRVRTDHGQELRAWHVERDGYVVALASRRQAVRGMSER